MEFFSFLKLDLESFFLVKMNSWITFFDEARCMDLLLLIKLDLCFHFYGPGFMDALFLNWIYGFDFI